MIEKIIDVKAKVSLQLLSRTMKINSRYPKGYKSLAKKEKDKANWKYWDKAFNKDKDKIKSHNSFFANS